MKRVLIIGPNYYNFLPAVSEAFRELGWEAVVVGYDNPIHPYTGWMRLRYRISRHRERLQQKSRADFRRNIEARFSALHPDLVFVLNGDILELGTLDCFRTSAKLAFWLFDSRTKLPDSPRQAAHTDAFFCFEQADVRWFRSRGQRAFFLPQACDPLVYHPIPGMRKDIDILFVGNMFYSPRRKALMNAVAARFPQRSVVAYGWYQPWFKGLTAWIRRPYKRVFRNVNVSSKKANLLYNRAKCVLNIHQEHQQDGANPRVFEICGAGAWQICDRNPYVEQLLPEGSIALYDSQDELFARIEEALTHDKHEAAAQACALVRAQHSFRNRMEEVLRIVYGSSEAAN